METTENVTNAPEKADTEAKADTENKDTADTAGETAPTEAEAPDAAETSRLIHDPALLFGIGLNERIPIH